MKTVAPSAKAASAKRPPASAGAGGAALPRTSADKSAKPAKHAKASAKKPAASAGAVAVRRPRLIWRARDQENSLLYNLQLDVASLQSELQGLRAYREILMERALNRQDDLDGSFVRIVREYFRVFHHGYTTGHRTRKQRLLSLPSSGGASSPSVATPDEFLHHVMDEDVLSGRFAGLTVITKQWERYSSVFRPMRLSFLDSQIISTFRGSGEGQDQVLVTSRAEYHLYISLRTIEIMFPHILPHQELVTRILGRHISGVGKFDFVFNTANNRIVRYEFSLDLTQSFVDLLRDPAVVSLLLKDALISDEFFIGDLSDIIPGRPQAPPLLTVETPVSDSTRETLPAQDAKPAQVRPWKMTLSSILCAADDADSDDCGRAGGQDVAMDEWEPHAERAPDGDDAAITQDHELFHDHRAPVRFEML